MSYQYGRVYTCNLCGSTLVVEKSLYWGWGSPKRWGWTGRFTRGGQCFCEACSQAIMETRASRNRGLTDEEAGR